jgi:hypothetical protein
MSVILPYEKKIQKQQVLAYKKEQRTFLLTSRFNNNTWSENEEYRNKNANIKCIYCSPDTITKSIPIDSINFILEMNNDTNRIMGIGMIRNHPIMNKFQVYENGNYNRYVYIGKNRIDRDTMSEEEEQVMQVFDILCFKGNHHMKRGQGLKSFPVDMLYRCSKKLDLVKFISQMFKKRLLKNDEPDKTYKSLI